MSHFKSQRQSNGQLPTHSLLSLDISLLWQKKCLFALQKGVGEFEKIRDYFAKYHDEKYLDKEKYPYRISNVRQSDLEKVPWDEYKNYFAKESIIWQRCAFPSGNFAKSLNFDNQQFIRCDFGAIQFLNFVFDECYFEHCDFSYTYWQKAIVIDCTGEGNNWTKARFKQSNISWEAEKLSTYKEAEFKSCNIGWRLGEKLDLREVDAANCLIKKTHLKECEVERSGWGIGSARCRSQDLLLTNLKGQSLGDSINKLQDA